MNASIQNYELEKRTVRKAYWKIIPLLVLAYMMAYIDRANVSFAALEMNKELGFSNAVYGLGAGMFFIGYFFLEIPGNLILTKVGARVWFTRIMITWGIISGLTALVETPMHFYIIRFLLGAAEASLSPGLAYYLGLWFLDRHYAKAFSMMFISMPIANIIVAPVSTFLLGLSGFGLAGWQWLYIIEAVPAVIMGIVIWFCLTDTPEKAKWLDHEEKEWLVKAKAEEKALKESRLHVGLLDAFKNKSVIMMTAGYFLWITGMYGVGLFTPIFVKTLAGNMSNQTVGYIVMIPYIVSLFTLLLWGRHSDAKHEREYHVAAGVVIAGIALLCCTYFVSVSMVLTLIFLSITIAAYNSAFAPFWAMPAALFTGVNAAGAMALIGSVGNLGGFVGPYLIGHIQSVTGSFQTGLIVLSISLMLCGVMMVFLKRESNKIKAGGKG